MGNERTKLFNVPRSHQDNPDPEAQEKSFFMVFLSICENCICLIPGTNRELAKLWQKFISVKP